MLTLMMAHWLACMWGFVGRATGSDDAEYAAELTAFSPRDYHNQNWVIRASLTEAGPFELYSVALYVALNNIFGGSCDIAPANFYEFWVQGFMMLLGSSIWAYILASAFGIIATLNPEQIEHRQTMDELNYFCNDKKIHQDLAVRLRTYFSQTQHLLRAKRYDTLMDKMSNRLRGDTALVVAKKVLGRVYYFGDPEIEPDFLANVALLLRLSMFCPREYIPCTNLTIIERGIGAKNGLIAIVGHCFGHDMIVASNAFRDLEPAIALTFVQVMVLERKDLDAILDGYPIAREKVRLAAFRMALKRGFLEVAKRMKMERLLEGAAQQFTAASRAATTRTKTVATAMKRLRATAAQTTAMSKKTTDERIKAVDEKLTTVGGRVKDLSRKFDDLARRLDGGDAPSSPEVVPTLSPPLRRSSTQESLLSRMSAGSAVDDGGAAIGSGACMAQLLRRASSRRSLDLTAGGAGGRAALEDIVRQLQTLLAAAPAPADAAVETPITRSQSVGAPPRSASTGTPGCRPTHHPGADSTGCRRSSNRESSRDSNQQVRFEYHVVPQPDTVDAALRAAGGAQERRPPRYHQKGRRRPTPRRPPTESDTSSPLDA